MHQSQSAFYISVQAISFTACGQKGLRQCTAIGLSDSVLITSCACHGPGAKDVPPVSLLETSYAFKGNKLAAVLFNFLAHASGKALMPDQYPDGNLCGLQPNSLSPYAVTKHPSLVLTIPACTPGAAMSK